MRLSLKAWNSRALPRVAVPAILSVAVAVLAGVPSQAQFVDAGRAAGPVDGGSPANLTMPMPLLHEPLETQAPDPATVAGALTAVAVTQLGGGVGDIPANVLKAYKSAAASVGKSDASCNLDWTVLAGIGKVESGHARGGAVDETGRTTLPILGPVLAGGPGIATIHDTDDGKYDENENWDRAVGPMQFIPSSWSTHAADGNKDGSSDPSNIYDASLASAGYLCTGDRDLSKSDDLKKAIFGYNHSWDYVATVLAWTEAYDGGGAVAVMPVALVGGSGTATPAATSKRAGQTAGKGDRAPAPGRPSLPTPSPTPSPSAVEAAATPAPGSPIVAAGLAPAGSPGAASGSGAPAGSPAAAGSAAPPDTSAPSSSAEAGAPTPAETPSPTPGPTTAPPSPTPDPTTTPPADPTPTPTPTDVPTSCPTLPPVDPTVTPTPVPTDPAVPDPCATTPPAPTPAPDPTPPV
jgi:membrane-bound lytic murein transglycosylase B